jgi:murein DD-endopeptidase MepM/ murein hydrolase activator NlpD
MGGVARRRAAWGLPLAALLAACVSTPDGTLHVVRPGENLYRISRFYGVEVDALVRANRIRDVTALAIGQRLVIPGSHRAQPKLALLPEEAPGRASRVRRTPARNGDGAQALREADLRFGWPVQGRINSRFGWRDGRRHEGVDIKAEKGAPVRAAEAGKVIYSGRLADYGKVIILKHAGRYSSVYAHNHDNRVRKGQFVEKGETIASVGRTGNASGPHLHFEVRRDRVAQDPLRFLPDLSFAARR